MGQTPKPTQSSLSSKENGNTTSGVSQSQSQSQKRKLPTAQELISHYESKGMDTKEASLKVIDDLQKALFRVVVSTSKSNTSGTKRKNYDQQQLTAGTSISRKLDVINSRLLNLEMKVDSKPGYGETLAIGLASGAAFRGLESIFPHVAGALAHIWNSVRSATNH